MFRLINLLLAGALLAGLLLSSAPVQAKQSKYMFKVASLAPDGSIWAKRFQAFVREVGEKTNGEVGFKIYAGGVMGDDQDMYRKMKIGQLHGGGFTMTGIGEIVPDFRVIGIPFLFRSYVSRLRNPRDLASVRKGFCREKSRSAGYFRGRLYLHHVH